MSECEKRYPRHLVAKPQKKHTLYYWQPSTGLKRSGYKTVPLGTDEAAAIQGAEAINAKVDQWRGGLPVLAKNRLGTIPWIIEQYKQSPGWHKLRASTKRARKSEFGRILRWSAQRGDPPMRTITKRDAQQYWSSMHESEGMPIRAQTIISRCTMLWNYALDLDEDIVSKNPFCKLDMPTLPPRDEVWTPGQIAAMIETALATPVCRRGGDPRPGCIMRP
jgi:hypothetical protein